MAVTDKVESKEAAGPSRPPARPSKPSRHHLEPNPFEQSFSSKPSNDGSMSPDGSRSSRGEKKVNKSRKSEASIKEEGEEEQNQDSSSKGLDGSSRSNGPLTPSATQTPSKRILPPVSSIASPAPHETSSMQYPWSSSITGSLRSGPLSPAMLAGPQSSFDVSSFRSGFTPDLSNFKTGLTPLGASSSFPPPSPNTAAFLAMVTNASGATITPNTLSALSGNPMDSHVNGASAISSQPGNSGDRNGQNHHHGEHHDQFDFAFGRSMQETPTKGGHHPSSKLRMSTGNIDEQSASPDPDVASTDQQRQQRQQEQAMKSQGGGDGGTNQQQTTQAASGLFLLSQAHQELAKRENAAAAAAAASHQTHDGPDGQQLYSNNINNNKKAGNKRKKSVEPANVTKGAGKKTKANKMDEMVSMMDDEGYESDELDEDGNRRQKSSNGDGGDDEEKRKNFLERNRQAALKCRQRKKAWLASLQQKVEYLQSDNENLQGTVGALRNEVMFLKSQLMQAQRQLGGGHGMDGGVTAAAAAGAGQSPTLGRNTIGGSVSMQGGVGNGMGMSHNLPPHSQAHQQNNINAMTAAVAAANNNNGNNRMGGATSGQYQAHAVPRPTHIPGQPNNNQQQYVSPNVHKTHPRQSSAQAA